jgi:hypothetical protein
MGTYAGVYIMGSSFRPCYFNPEHWTVGKELKMLLVFFPIIACSSLVFALLSIEEFQLTVSSFFQLQRYNIVMGLFAFPGFGYFVSKKLIPVRQKEEESPLANDEVQAENPEKQETPITPAVPTAADNLIVIKNIHLDATNIIFAESSRNHLHVYHVYNGKVQELEKALTLTEF